MAKKFADAGYKEKLELVATQDPAINHYVQAPRRELCSIIALGFLAIVEILEDNTGRKSSKKTSSENK